MPTSSHQDAYAAVRKVLEALPPSLHGYWWSSKDLARILSTGGVENVNEETIARALNNERSGIFQRDFTLNERYFMLGEPIQEGWSVVQQYDKRVLPKIATDLFKAKPSLANAIKTINDHDWNVLTPSSADDSEKAAHVPKSIQYKNWADKSAGGKNVAKTILQMSTPPGGSDDSSSHELLGDESLDCEVDSREPWGFFLQSMNEDIEWTFKIHDHARACRGYLSPVINSKKKGWKMRFEYSCSFCKQIFVKQSAPNSDSPQSKRGPKQSSVNVNLAVAFYVSGIMIEKALVLFAEAGVVAPTAKNLEDMLEKVKAAAKYLSEEKLCENRKEHIKACRETPGYKGDIQWTDDTGMKHRVWLVVPPRWTGVVSSVPTIIIFWAHSMC
jgi:hypothetical protein